MDQKVNKTKLWNITDNRFVAFIDIMGFKDLVMRKSHDDVYQMMMEISSLKDIIHEIINTKLSDKYKDIEIYITTFSDSIAIFTSDDSVLSFELLLDATSSLFASAMYQGIPLKGAIAHGKTSVNIERQIFFGQSIIDAYLLQEEVNYYGVAFHNSTDAYIDSKGLKIDKIRYFEAKTYLKGGQINHRNLIWFDFLIMQPEEKERDAKLSTQVVFNNMIHGFKLITSGQPRIYIDNTVEMYERFNQIKK